MPAEDQVIFYFLFRKR